MKLNYKRTLLIGLAFLSISAFWQMYDNVIPLILKNTFHMGETLTGAIMAADNIMLLENGIITATGKHDELLEGCKGYQELYDTQFSKVIEYEKDKILKND